MFVFVSPFGSPLQILTLVGMLFVVIGYGMYQPAAYAGVRKFTTPKTAAMGFAMLYALMNLGGWLPSFAFLLRDDDYLGLGIPGTFWVYAGFTVIALLCTVFILSRRTVTEAVARAKAETARIKAEEAGEGQPEAQSESTDQTNTPSSGASIAEPLRVKPHMWLFWVAGIALILFKGESPWYYTWTELAGGWATAGLLSGVVWRWIIAGAIFISPVLFALIPKAKRWIAQHPLEDGKFSYFIFALIPVQTLFTYNWFILPAYINRAFEGWIGDKFEFAANLNPILIFIAVPMIAALTQRAKVYNMMIYGTFVMAAPAFLLVLGPHWWTLFPYIFVMTIGEAMWQPRFLQYAAEIAPEGRTGEYMGVAQLPWFLTKVLVPLLYSGRMMDRFCPAEGPKSTEVMWLIFGFIAISSTVLLLLAKGWIGKDFKTKAD
jgi:heme exporter protein D